MPVQDSEAEAALLAFFILAGNTFLRPLVAFIERRPVDERAAEATFEVRLTVSEPARDAIRDLLFEKLEAASYSVRKVEGFEREDRLELVATLSPTSAVADELDTVTREFEKVPGGAHATWASRTID